MKWYVVDNRGNISPAPGTDMSGRAITALTLVHLESFLATHAR